MHNQELAHIFYQMAVYLEMEDDPYRPQAYEKAAITLETLEEDVAATYRRGGLKALLEIPNVGEGIARKIAEFLRTGRVGYYEALRRKVPVDIEELMRVEGLGPKRIKTLYHKLHVKDLDDLERAAKVHRIAPLFGFGEKTEQNILEGIKFVRRSGGRFLLGEILPYAENVMRRLKAHRAIERLSLGGSIRRMKETIGDVDILAVSRDPGLVMDYFTNLPGVIKVWGRGPTKASIRVKEGFDLDLRIVPHRSYGAALQYFTGNKEHNVILRRLAIDKGLKLSEYGLFRGPRMIAGDTEESIYLALGLPWIEPELRQNSGEIEAARTGTLPQLVNLKDIRGDLHVHSDWDGGQHSIEEIAARARAMDYAYVGIADHTQALKIENGLDEQRLRQRNRAIDELNASRKFPDLWVLKGCEANIMEDGSIDIADKALEELDFVIAGVHSHLKMPKNEMTARLAKAMQNPHVDIISHPTGRILKKRDEYEADFDEVLRVAEATGTVLEINSNPYRLDLNHTNVRKAKEAGVRMIINTDAHHIDHLNLMKFGVSQARRGWAEKKDIVNTSPAKDLLGLFKAGRYTPHERPSG